MLMTVPAEESETLSIPANRLRKAFDWLENPELPLPLVITINATLWLQQVEAFRKEEDRHLAEGDYNETLDLHRMILSRLIAEGETIVGVAARNGLTQLQSGWSLEDIRSTVESLHTSFRCQYGPHNSSQTNSAIEQLFEA